METSLLSAALALFGAVTGTGITAASNWAISSHRERLELRREKLGKQTELRKASRQVGQDLIDGAIVANIRLAEHRWEMPDSELKLELWEKHHELLSSELT